MLTSFRDWLFIHFNQIFDKHLVPTVALSPRRKPRVDAFLLSPAPWPTDMKFQIKTHFLDLIDLLTWHSLLLTPSFNFDTRIVDGYIHQL